MPESPDELLTPNQQEDRGFNWKVLFLEITGVVIFVSLSVFCFSLLLPIPTDTNGPTIHENCKIESINGTARRGGIYTRIYTSGCTNSQHTLEYFDGPVYKNIQEYEKAKAEKGDNYIQLHKTYTFTNQGYIALGKYHEKIKDFTLVK